MVVLLTRDDARILPPAPRAALEYLRKGGNYEYVPLDLERAVESLDRLEPIEEFVRIASRIEAAEE